MSILWWKLEYIVGEQNPDSNLESLQDHNIEYKMDYHKQEHET